MHKKRTSKLARETRRKGGLRTKRTSMAEVETGVKESMAEATVPEAEPVRKKATRHGASHTRKHTKAGKAGWPRAS